MCFGRFPCVVYVCILYYNLYLSVCRYSRFPAAAEACFSPYVMSHLLFRGTRRRANFDLFWFLLHTDLLFVFWMFICLFFCFGTHRRNERTFLRVAAWIAQGRLLVRSCVPLAAWEGSLAALLMIYDHVRSFLREGFFEPIQYSTTQLVDGQ